MAEVISIKFKDSGRAYFFDPCGKKYNIGDKLMVETANGLAFGTVSKANHTVPQESIVGALKSVVRVANDADLAQIEENRKKEKEALAVCEKMVEEHGLDMKLVSVEYTFDGSKITFFFTSDGRVDFRELVRALAAHFRTRIELRQIGIRDEARMLGGMSVCGQPFCCTRFLDGFQSVSMKMAKIQGISLNPAKISGSCGRLMCCLQYENDTYEYLASVTPHVGDTVKTPDGIGTVTDVNFISGNLMVKMKDSETMPVKIHRSRVKPLGKKPSGDSQKEQKGKNAKNH